MSGKTTVSRVRMFACLFLVLVASLVAVTLRAPAASADPTTYNSGACNDYPVPAGTNVLQVDAVGDGGDDGISASAAGHTNNGGAGGSGAHVTALIATNGATDYYVMVGDNSAQGIGNHGTGGGSVFAGGASGINSDPGCDSSGWQIMAGGGGSGSDAIVGNDGVSGGSGCDTVQWPGTPINGLPCPTASGGNNNHLLSPCGAGGAGGNGVFSTGGSRRRGRELPAPGRRSERGCRDVPERRGWRPVQRHLRWYRRLRRRRLRRRRWRRRRCHRRDGRRRRRRVKRRPGDHPHDTADLRGGERLGGRRQ